MFGLGDEAQADEVDQNTDGQVTKTDEHSKVDQNINFEAQEDADADADNTEKLPDTGENDNYNTTLFGGLLAGLGSLFLFARRRKEEK